MPDDLHPMDEPLFIPEEPGPDLPFEPEPEDKISADVWLAEKAVIEEKMKLLRARHESDLRQLNAILAGKEQDLLAARARADELEVRLKDMRDKSSEDRRAQFENMNSVVRQREISLQAEKDKWNIIGDEVAEYKAFAESARNQLQVELVRIRNAKAAFIEQERKLREQLSEQEEEITSLRESLTQKEDQLLRERSAAQDKLRELQLKAEQLEKVQDSDKSGLTAVTAEKNKTIAELQKALSSMMVQCTEARQSIERLQEKSAEQELTIKALELTLNPESGPEQPEPPMDPHA